MSVVSVPSTDGRVEESVEGSASVEESASVGIGIAGSASPGMSIAVALPEPGTVWKAIIRGDSSSPRHVTGSCSYLQYTRGFFGALTRLLPGAEGVGGLRYRGGMGTRVTGARRRVERRSSPPSGLPGSRRLGFCQDPCGSRRCCFGPRPQHGDRRENGAPNAWWRSGPHQHRIPGRRLTSVTYSVWTHVADRSGLGCFRSGCNRSWHAAPA
jgi:hypothetical protein